MRHLFVTPAYPPFTGGGERYVRSLALALIAAGHPVTVMTSEARTEADFWQTPRPVTPPPTTTQEGPIPVIRCALRGIPAGRRGLHAWRKSMVLLSALPGDQAQRLRRMARLIPPIDDLAGTLAGLPDSFDVVTGFNLSWEHAALVAQEFAQQRGLPFVLIPFGHLEDGRRGRVARNATMDHQRQMVNGADLVLTLTEAEITGFAHWGFWPRQVAVIGSGFDPVPPLPDPAGALARHDLTLPFAIFVGRINYNKGAIHATQAIIKLRQAGAKLSLVLVGRVGADFDRFYTGLSSQEQAVIRPVGTVSDEDKHSLINQAEMLLLPSRTDSFGIVLLEAWIHGKPVVGARVGGIASVVSHEEDGLLVPFGNVPALVTAIECLHNDAARRQQYGQTGREKVLARYTWDRVAEKAIAHYVKLKVF